MNFLPYLTVLILSHYTIYSHVYTENIFPPIGLEMRAITPRTSNIDGMPHNPSPEHDRIGDAVAKIDSVKRTIAERNAQANKVYGEIDAMIERLQGRYAHLWRIVLQLRYLDHAEWNEINFSIFGGKDDYSDKEESYMRRVYTYHKDALVALLNLIPAETLQEFAEETEDRK